MSPVFNLLSNFYGCMGVIVCTFAAGVKMMVAISLADAFRANLRKALKEKGLTQKQLAKLSGVGREHICKILGGKHEPTLSICDALARGMNLPPEKLMVKS